MMIEALRQQQCPLIHDSCKTVFMARTAYAAQRYYQPAKRESKNAPYNVYDNIHPDVILIPERWTCPPPRALLDSLERG